MLSAMNPFWILLVVTVVLLVAKVAAAVRDDGYGANPPPRSHPAHDADAVDPFNPRRA